MNKKSTLRNGSVTKIIDSSIDKQDKPVKPKGKEDTGNEDKTQSNSSKN